MDTNRRTFMGSRTWIEMFEVIPPRNANPEALLHDLPPPGFGLLSISDNPGAMPAMSASAAACHLIRNGYDPVLMINCRDRNRIDIQSVVLGAVSLGVRFFLIQPGIHQTLGPMREAKNVYDIDPIQTLKILNDMRRRRIFSNHTRIPGTMDYFIGLFEHPMNGDLDLKPFFFRKKLWHEVDFIVTDPITDFDRLIAWRSAIAGVEGSERIPIFIGLPDVHGVVPETIRQSGHYAGVYYSGAKT